MAITRNTLSTASWDLIYTYLQTTNAITTNNIYSSYNSTLVKTTGYPIVIIAPPVISFIKLSADGSMTESQLSFLFEIYEDNAQDLKALFDNVTTKVLAGRTVFAGQDNRLMRMAIESGDYDTWVDGNKKIHRQSFSLTFRYIGP